MLFYGDIVITFFLCAHLVFLYFIWRESVTARNELETIREMIRDARLHLRALESVTYEIKTLLDECKADSILSAGKPKKKGRPKKPSTFNINMDHFDKGDSK